MKPLVLTPEWVLSNLSHTHFCNGEGRATIVINSFTQFSFIHLAFTTLGIDFEEYNCVDNRDTYYEFNLVDIQDECPNFYAELKRLDDDNANRAA